MISIYNARTFQTDLHLPSLPFPSLKKTLLMYIDILSVLVPTHLFLSTKEEIEKFAIEESYIMEYNHKKGKENSKNWLEKWWLEKYHLKTNTELIPFTSLCGVSSLHENIWFPDLHSQIERGAKYLHGLLTCWICLRHEVIAPDRTEDGEMLSMNMYKSVFNAGRMPSSSGDIVYRYFKTVCEGDCPTHILLSIKGCTFKVNFIENEGVWPLCKIRNTFTQIVEYLKAKEINNNVTPATSLPKPHLLSALSFSNIKNEFIENIKTSILWMALDDATPSFENLLLSVMTADSQNRCGIKAFSVTIFANGLIGLNADSALIDPIIFSRIIHFADRHVSNDFSKDDYNLPNKLFIVTKTILRNWNMFEYNFPGVLRNEIDYIKRIYSIKAYQLDSNYQFYEGFNLQLSKFWNIDPCITVHLLILLTNWEINKTFSSTCAVVSHRKFYRGRQDMVPTIILDVVNWITAVSSKKCSFEKLKVLFILAHQNLRKMFHYCENNCGPVLHLNYLNSCFRDTSRSLADLCDNSFWYESGFNDNFAIKTYWLGNQHVVVAVPPVMRMGFTCSYSVTEESTLVTAAYMCWENQINPRYSKLFLKEFLASVNILIDIFSK